MGALSKIKQAGFDVLLIDGFIEVNPASELTQRQLEFLKSHKAEIISELQAESLVTHPEKQKPTSCGKCLQFKSHHSHGAGAGHCQSDGAYGAWSETQHQCSRFDAAVERAVMPDPKPNALMVTVYTPNGDPLEVEAKDEAHAVFLMKMNPKPKA